MHKSVRIKFNPLEEGVEDKHIKVNLEQSTDTLELLSMKFDLKEAYQAFNSNYGVLVGRVIANDGIGVPNAKISVFIPLEEEDETESQIYRVYPYKSPRDKNNEGKRYNLLPRVAKYDSERLSFQPAQPFGSFPTKEEILTNDNLLKVYKKYYKYTTITNDSGDYIIFGVPVGLHTVHLSLDITDIGEYSMNPASMITNLGYSPNFFTDNGTKLKPNNDLNDLPHIETQEISVDVIPFWGDTENFQIGITQQDFRVRAQLVNTVTIFGTAFTDGDDFMWGKDMGSGFSNRRRSLNRAREDNNPGLSMSNKRTGRVTEKIYYYPTSVSDQEIENNKTNPNYDGSDMFLLDPSEYTVYKRAGDFVFIVNCNRRKIIKDEIGGEIVVGDDNPAGVFTEFKGFITLEIDNTDVPLDIRAHIRTYPLIGIRSRLKFPQYANRANSFAHFRAGNIQNNEAEAEINTANWRAQHKTFEAGKIYSIARFHGTVHNNHGDADYDFGFNINEKINKLYNEDPYWNTGIIASEFISEDTEEDEDEEAGDTGDTSTFIKEEGLVNNSIVTNIDLKVFGGNWLNLAVYFPQFGYLNPTTVSRNRMQSLKSTSNFSQDFRRTRYSGLPADRNYFWDNNQIIAAGQRNTKWFIRSDLHWTDFVEVTREDINIMLEQEKKGFTGGVGGEIPNLMIENYRNGSNPSPPDWSVTTPCPMNGGKVNGTANPTHPADQKIYFFTGLGPSDCIQFLQDLGLI